jgi:octaprenyl-diphosphate synthase
MTELKRLIAGETAEIDRHMRADLERYENSLDPLLLEILEYSLFSGGKRVRPLLAVLSGRLCGSDDPSLYDLAIGFEYLHVATLCHDDVIDQAHSRRGRETVNKRYGMVGAILAGDFLHAHSLDIVGRHGGTEALEVLSEATRGMVDGEFIQLRNRRNFAQSEADYFDVIMGKTALLIGSACEIGAIYGGADRAQRDGLRKYGLSLGCAFQIVDDLLDYLGEPDRTGKRIGNDLAEAKMTLPLILAFDHAEPADHGRLMAILEQEEGRLDHLDEVVALIEKYNGFDVAKKRAEAIIDEAQEALATSLRGSNPPSYTLLRDLADYVLNRDR